MAKKNKIAKEIRIQRLQDKNKMVMSAFNPTGITSAEISEKYQTEISFWQNATSEYKREFFNKMWQFIVNEHVGSWQIKWIVFEKMCIDLNGNLIE